MEGTWLTVGQAAKRSGYSESTIRRWVDSGVLVASRSPTGGARRIQEESLQQVLAASHRPNVAAIPESTKALTLERWGSEAAQLTSFVPDPQMGSARLIRMRRILSELDDVVHYLGPELDAAITEAEDLESEH